MASVLVAWLAMSAALPPVLWGSVVALLAVSLLEDFRGVPIALRLLTHGAAAALTAEMLFHGTAGILIVIVLAAAIVWVTNLYNFMDGSDGLAGGMAVFGFSAYGIAAWLAGRADFAAAEFCIAAAAAGFLAFNFHPARIFLGDAGSIPWDFLPPGWVAGWATASGRSGFRCWYFLRSSWTPAPPWRAGCGGGKNLAGPPGALLSAPGEDGLGTPQYGACRIRCYDSGRRKRPVGQRKKRAHPAWAVRRVGHGLRHAGNPR